MKKIAQLFLISLLFSSCNNLDGGSYSSFTDWVNVIESHVPDSTLAGQEIMISAKAQAPNGCWSGLTLYMSKYSQFIYTVNARGAYESYDGFCPGIVISADTTFKFTPDSAGLYVFVFQSPSLESEYDTLIVSLPGGAAR